MAENVCSQCGAPLAPGATECKYCGSRVEVKQAAVHQEDAQVPPVINIVKPSASPVQKGPTNKLGTAGFVLGLIGLVFTLISFADRFAAAGMSPCCWTLVVLGIIFSACGLRSSRRGKRGIAAAGLALSLIGLILMIIFFSGL